MASRRSRRPPFPLFARSLAVAAVFIAGGEPSARATTSSPLAETTSCPLAPRSGERATERGTREPELLTQSNAPPPTAAPPPTYYPPPAAYPPPGYYYPAPTYYPPPAFAPPGHTRPPPPPARRLFQLIPYIGVHTFQGANATILGPGLRVGALIGFRVNDYITFNAELTVDNLNATSLPPGDSRFAGDTYDEVQGLIGISPLVAFPTGNVELALGPKLAFWGADYDQSSHARGSGYGTYSGIDLGANAAVFAHTSRRLWLGALASFDARTYSNICFTASAGHERCTRTDLPSADKVLAVSALLMFSP